MKNSLHGTVWTVALWCLLPYGAGAQAAFNLKTGIETWSFRDELELMDQSRHPGQMIGFDIIVEKNRGLFMPGFHYHRISALHESKAFRYAFDPSHHYHFFTIPLAFGYRFVDRKALGVSLLGGGEAQFFYSLDTNPVGLDDDMVYGVTAALTGIVHLIFFSHLTAELRYHHGLLPVLRIREDSKLRGLTVAVGVKL